MFNIFVSLLFPSCLPPVSLLSPSCLPPVSLLSPSCLPPVSLLSPSCLSPSCLSPSGLSPSWLPPALRQLFVLPIFAHLFRGPLTFLSRQELRVKHDQTSCCSRPPLLGTPSVRSRTRTERARSSQTDLFWHTTLYYTILYHTILYHTILNYTILHYTIPYYTILDYTNFFWRDIGGPTGQRRSLSTVDVCIYLHVTCYNIYIYIYIHTYTNTNYYYHYCIHVASLSAGLKSRRRALRGPQYL